MKFKASLAARILPALNNEVSSVITTEREEFSGRIIEVIEKLTELQDNLNDTAPIDVEIAIEGMVTEVESVAKHFTASLLRICGNDGELAMVRQVAGETPEERQRRLDHRTAKRNEARAEREGKRAIREERKAERAAKREERQARLAAIGKGPKKTTKKTTKKS